MHCPTFFRTRIAMTALTPLQSLDEIRARSVNAVLAQSGLAHPGLAAEIRRRLGSRDAARGGLLTEPVIEAAPDYTRSDEPFAAFEGTLLHSATIAALDGANDPRQDRHRFPRGRRPFTHQVEAWHLLADPAVNRSILISSGTSSGKTECFVVPILDYLVRSAQSQDAPLIGVEAMLSRNACSYCSSPRPWSHAQCPRSPPVADLRRVRSLYRKLPRRANAQRGFSQPRVTRRIKQR